MTSETALHRLSYIKLITIITILWSIIVLLGLILLTPNSYSGVSLIQPIYDKSKLSEKIDIGSSVSFTDTTLESGILTPHSQRSGNVTGLHETLGSGVCSLDIDNDGWLDIITLNGSGSTHYFGKPQWWQQNLTSVSVYLNNRNGSFADISSTAGISSSMPTMGCTVGDLDNDGDQDIFLSNRGNNELWGNKGDNTFEKILNYVEGEQNQWSAGATIADFNNDGLPDIYVVNYLTFQPNSLTFEVSAGYSNSNAGNFNSSLHAGASNRLLINQGKLSFTDKTKTWGVSNSQGRGLAAFASDINADGRIDLLVANDIASENKVFINQGNAFLDRSTDSSLGIADGTTGIILEDLDQDTQSELLITTSYSNHNKIFRAKSEKLLNYSDLSQTWQMHTQTDTLEQSWSPAIADFNMDGWSDILIPNGLTKPNEDANAISQDQKNYLLINNGQQELRRNQIQLSKTIITTGSARCAISGDFNNDGQPDALIATNNGLPQLLINQHEPKNWIGFVIKNNYNSVPNPVKQIDIATNLRHLTHNITNGSRGFCWQDNNHFSLALLENETPQEIKLTHQNGSTRQVLNLDNHQYNIIDVSDKTTKALPTRKERVYSSNIKLTHEQNKHHVIAWLIKQGKSKQAYNELKQLLYSSDAEVRITAATTSQLMTLNDQLRIIPSLLRDSNIDVQHIAINMIKNSEDERLAGHLFGAINDKNSAIACHAMNVLQHFFMEEEAMLINKYAGLDSLIQITSSEETDKQICAIQALGESEHYRTLEPLLVALANEHVDIRTEAIKSLGRIRERNAIPALKQVFNNHSETEQNRSLALQSIYQIDVSHDISTLIHSALSNAGSEANLTKTLSTLAMGTNFDQLNNIIPANKLANPTRSWFESNKVKLNSEAQQEYQKIISARMTVNAQDPSQLNQGVLSKKTCDGLFSLFSDTKKNASKINQFITEQDIQFLAPCYQTVFLNEMPKNADNVIQSGSSYDQVMLAFIAPRSEKWAREFIISALSEQKTTIDNKVFLINNLPSKPTPSIQKTLENLFINDQQNKVSLAAASNLSKNLDWLTKHSNLIEQRINENLSNRNEEVAVKYAELLIGIKPDTVLSIFLN